MNGERGDFKWKGDEVVWEASEKGALIIHPVLGPMPYNSSLAGCIISPGLAKMIDEELKKQIRKNDKEDDKS